MSDYIDVTVTPIGGDPEPSGSKTLRRGRKLAADLKSRQRREEIESANAVEAEVRPKPVIELRHGVADQPYVEPKIVDGTAVSPDPATVDGDTVQLEVLLAQANELGIEVGARWGVARIQKAIDAKLAE